MFDVQKQLILSFRNGFGEFISPWQITASLNSKSEARNPKQIQMFKTQMTKTKSFAGKR
jgi:hypothetical protein